MAFVNLPHTFSPNTPIYSGQVNADLQAIAAQVNGNLDASNLASGAVTTSRAATWPRASARITTPFNQLSGQGTTVFLGTADYDTDNLYDDVNDYFTVITAGTYLVSGYVKQAAVGAGFLGVRRGPGGVFVADTYIGTDDNRNGSGQFLTASGHTYFAAGDRIDMVWVNFAGGQNGLSAGFLAAQWLGP